MSPDLSQAIQDLFDEHRRAGTVPGLVAALLDVQALVIATVEHDGGASVDYAITKTANPMLAAAVADVTHAALEALNSFVKPEPRKASAGDVLTDSNPWVIELRNGSYFAGLEADHGVALERAKRFPTMRSVDDFLTDNEWVLYAGGMPVEICASCSKPVAHRGQVHCP